ncbi:beta-lactamase family protein, partial [Candidatus Bathyarchaeota archaeon]|nr:beta-lactamase family protein [Candidatus Bathyarchaeota archaeon]
MTMLNSKKTLDLESFIFKRMGDSGIVGLSIAIIEDDEITYKKGFGFRDFIQGSSATPETIYCIGSVTKTFTALGIMQLHEKGLININDPVDKYIPFKSKANGEEVLIKHILSHSSGFSALGYAEATLGMVTGIYDRWFPIASPQDLLMFMNGAEDWAITKPGERHAYLNEGYIILGSIIEKASGTSYPDYIKENILKPLGMNKSTFKEEDIINEKDVATPYITSESGVKVATRYPYGQMIADGGLMSNSEEMVRYIRALLSKGTLEGVKI